MYKTKDNVEKICNLSASDWHMLTTILTFLKEKDFTFEPVAFISEKPLNKDLSFLLSKINIPKEQKIAIENIPWYQNINNVGISNNSTYIISGSINYINSINKYLEKTIHKNITLINCFSVLNSPKEIKEIISKHDKILKTSGIQSI